MNGLKGMDASSRRLLFQIGTVGFCIGLNELVEIREQVAGQIETRQANQPQSVIGGLPFRQMTIPVIDLSLKLGFECFSPDIAVILSRSEAFCALLVDRVEGFYPEKEMLDCAVPLLLQAPDQRCYHQIALLAGAPYLLLDMVTCTGGDLG